MKILIAEDEKISRKILETTLTKAGHDVVAVEDGVKALESIRKVMPDMLVTDWMMPDLDGLELCRRVRALDLSTYVYIILLTALTQKENIIEGLDAGADDYVTKPFERTELLARVRAGERVIQLERSLRQKNKELSEALAHVKQLKGLLPICMFCKKIRNDKNYWQQVEEYLAEHTEADFSHSICPECLEKHYPDYVKKKKVQPDKVEHQDVSH
ncbi:MAG: response regulator [candidate division Zixibacteria bacterium]|nr:response regulator [candidate division Zixibacteria bacterium]